MACRRRPHGPVQRGQCGRIRDELVLFGSGKFVEAMVQRALGERRIEEVADTAGLVLSDGLRADQRVRDRIDDGRSDVRGMGRVVPVPARCANDRRRMRFLGQ